MNFSFGNKVSISDELFLKVEWEEGNSPKDLLELQEILDDMDQGHYGQINVRLEDNLPYLTFQQADILFHQLKIVFDTFTLKKVAVAHLEKGKPTTDNEVFLSPFIINEQYNNLIEPLMKELLVGTDFKSYSYQEKKEYFQDQVFPIYQKSLGISVTELPTFPEEGDIEVVSLKRNRHSITQESKEGKITQPQVSPPQKRSIVLYAGVALVSFIFGICICFLTFDSVKKSQEIHHLEKQIVGLQELQQKQLTIDVFARYFIPSYYSNNKELLKDFLDQGDAKFTSPQEGTVTSVLLESIQEDDGQFHLSYILSLKEGDNKKNVRMNLVVRENKKASHGYVVMEEPKISDY